MYIKKIELHLNENEMNLLIDAITDMKCNLSSDEKGKVLTDLSSFSEGRKKNIQSCADLQNMLRKKKTEHFGK
jgi:hypothetical protein